MEYNGNTFLIQMLYGTYVNVLVHDSNALSKHMVFSEILTL